MYKVLKWIKTISIVIPVPRIPKNRSSSMNLYSVLVPGTLKDHKFEVESLLSHWCTFSLRPYYPNGFQDSDKNEFENISTPPIFMKLCIVNKFYNFAFQDCRDLQDYGSPREIKIFCIECAWQKRNRNLFRSSSYSESIVRKTVRNKWRSQSRNFLKSSGIDFIHFAI